MKAHLKAGLKQGIRVAKYAALAHTLLIPLILSYCYFAGKPPNDGSVVLSERQLFIACIIGAMSIGTILLTALHDFGWEKKNAKYWLMLAYYGSLALAWTEGLSFVVAYSAIMMMLSFLLMELDDRLTARGWSASIPEPECELQRSPTHDELP